jgi:hypothetical protein
MGMDIHPGQFASQPVPLVTMRFALLAALHSHARATQRLQDVLYSTVAAPERAGRDVARRCRYEAIAHNAIFVVGQNAHTRGKSIDQNETNKCVLHTLLSLRLVWAYPPLGGSATGGWELCALHRCVTVQPRRT